MASECINSNENVIKRRIDKKKLIHDITTSEKNLNLIFNLFISDNNITSIPSPAEIQQEFKKKIRVVKP
ncbi:hypothetical protein AB9T88_05490 [Flavobacterium sp. LBUM151]